jgi:hypothetical protein
VTSSANAILHPWLKEELSNILQTLPPPKTLDVATNRKLWEMWQEGLSMPITLPETLPPFANALDLGQLTWTLYARNGALVV